MAANAACIFCKIIKGRCSIHNQISPFLAHERLYRIELGEGYSSTISLPRVEINFPVASIFAPPAPECLFSRTFSQELSFTHQRLIPDSQAYLTMHQVISQPSSSSRANACWLSWTFSRLRRDMLYVYPLSCAPSACESEDSRISLCTIYRYTVSSPEHNESAVP